MLTKNLSDQGTPTFRLLKSKNPYQIWSLLRYLLYLEEKWSRNLVRGLVKTLDGRSNSLNLHI